jgi:hypothetical protein
MPNCSQLPAWVSYGQVLAIPILGGVIALVGTLIAVRQMLIADERLEHDAFYRQYDNRFAVYEATRKLLASVFHEDIPQRIGS